MLTTTASDWSVVRIYPHRLRLIGPPQADAAKKSFATEGSDLLAGARAYDGWEAARRQGGRGAERAFVSEYFLSSRALDGIRDMRGQFWQVTRER